MTANKVKHFFATLLAALWLSAAAAPGVAIADTTIYYYRDERGAFHFTNRPESDKYRVFAIFRRLPEANREVIIGLARKYSEMHGLDHNLVLAVMEVESSFENRAVSSAGAQGLMQIMPDTQRELGVRRPFDPEENIAAGVRYLRQMFDRFGDWKLALAAYNAGPTQVERYNGVPPFKETQQYVAKVIALYNRIRAK